MSNTQELKKFIMGFDFVVIDADGSITSKQLDRDLSIEEMQKAVGGFVELLPVEIIKSYYIFCNEEGNIYKLPSNNKAGLLLDKFIRGNILFVKKEFVK